MLTAQQVADLNRGDPNLLPFLIAQAGGFGELVTQRQLVEIPNASLKVLNATPFEVIPAPPSTHFIEFLGVHCKLKFAVAAFDGVAAGDLFELRYTNAAGLLLNQTASPVGFANASADAHVTYLPVGTTTPISANVVAHLAATEWFTAAGGGSLLLSIAYRLRPLTPA